MMCYKDRSYCSSSKECGTKCALKLTDEHKANAERLNLSVAYADYRDTEHCPGFTKRESAE